MPEISNSENPYSTPTVDPILPEILPAGELDLATRKERLFGSLIDGFLFLVFLSLGEFLSNKFLHEPLDEVLINGLYIVFFLLVNSTFLAFRGQTVGKILMGTKIVKIDGGKPSLLRLIGLRYAPLWAAGLIPLAGDWIALINHLFIFREDHRCLHDHLAGTKVVKIGRLVAEMPQPRLMPRRNPAHAAHVLSKLLLEELDLVASEIPPGSRWIEDLNISPEDFAAFCRKLEEKFNTLTSYELEKCATYGDLLQLLGIPLVKRPR